MKEFFITVGYLLLALLWLPLKGFLYLLLWFFYGLPLVFWKKLSYTAQCLRYGTPQGGMYGNMARILRERNNKSTANC